MIEVFKIMRGMSKVEKNECFDLREEAEVRPTRSNTTVNDGVQQRRPDNLFKTRAKKEIRKNFFTAGGAAVERHSGRIKKPEND